VTHVIDGKSVADTCYW